MIQLKTFYLLFFIFTLFSCKKESKKTLPTTITNTDTVNIVKEKKTVNKDTTLYRIKDSLYVLKTGRNINNEKFSNAVLYLDKISETEYGFIKVVKIPELSPFKRFGILKSIDGKLYNISHCTEKDSSFHLMKGYRLIYKKEELAMIRYYSNSTDYFIWKPKAIDKKMHLSLRKTFKNTKAEYLDYKQEYLQFKAIKDNKLNTIFENNVWKTKHKHNPNTTFTHNYTAHKISAEDIEFLTQNKFEFTKTE